MQEQRPILSICLPTNGVVEWVIPTLESIYAQNVDFSLFEVVITDNGEDSRLGEALKDYKYPNLVYIQTKDKGFLNLVTCLQKGNGLFNKMLNHRMMLKPGMLQKMIDVVNQNKDSKPVLYFLNGCLNLQEFKVCENLNDFVYNMHFWVSWSAGIGFWDTDLPTLSQIEPNEMFPNTSLLFEHRLDSEYVIWNGSYGQMQDESGKGGYDLFHTFGVVLNDLIVELQQKRRISISVMKRFRRKLAKFLSGLYYTEVLNAKKSNRTFIVANVKHSLSEHYGLIGYYLIIFRAWLSFIKNSVIR